VGGSGDVRRLSHGSDKAWVPMGAAVGGQIGTFAPRSQPLGDRSTHSQGRSGPGLDSGGVR
jgi:hypothetical protein